jgi:phosphoribosylaminoimidazole-succinocarboxamide synthase
MKWASHEFQGLTRAARSLREVFTVFLNNQPTTRPAMSLLYEGKAKRLYSTDDDNVLLMEFKDDATAFNGQKKAQFADKGRLNKALTLKLYQLLEKEGVSTHFIEDQSPTTMLVKRVEIVPIELVVRNVVAGSLQKRTNLPEGQRLRQPIVETYYKDDDLGDPIITDDHIRELEIATTEDLAKMKRTGLKVNQLLINLFAKCGLVLVDFKLEFGKLYPDRKNIVLADEISPDTCRLWDAETGRKLDKDIFRQDLGDVMAGYAEILSRLEDALKS